MDAAATTPVAPDALADALTQPFAAKEAVSMIGRRVTGPLDLSGRALCGFDLSGSVFEGPVVLDGARLQGLACFRGCRFLRGFRAKGATFCADARLDGAEAQGLDLSRTEIRGALVLDGAHVQGTAFCDDMQVLGSLSMARTGFDGPVSLEGTEALGGLWADGARFGARVSAQGMEVHGRTWLRHASFADSAPLTRQAHLYGYLWS